MDDKTAQQFLEKLDSIDKHLAKTAEALSVFKVMMIALLIASLMVVWKNFM